MFCDFERRAETEIVRFYPPLEAARMRAAPRPAPAPPASRRSRGSSCCRSAPRATAAPPGPACGPSSRHSRAARHPRRVAVKSVAASTSANRRSIARASGVSSAAAFGVHRQRHLARQERRRLRQLHQRLRALLQARHQRQTRALDHRIEHDAGAGRAAAPSPPRSAAHRRPGAATRRSDACSLA